MADPQPKPTPAPAVPPGTAPPQNYEGFGKLMAVIGADSRYHDKMLNLIEEAVPDADRLVPEIAWRKRMAEELKAHGQGITERAQAAEQKVNQIEYRLARREFMDTHHLSEDDLSEVEELAKKGRIGSPEVAVDYWRQTTLGKARATTGPGSGLSADDTKELYKNPKAWYDKTAPKVLEQVRRLGRRGA